MVDRIEYHVEQSRDYVATGQEQLVQASKYMSKARKKKIFIIVCVAITLVILIVLLAVYLS